MPSNPTSSKTTQGLAALLSIGAGGSAHAAVVQSTTVNAPFRPPSAAGTINWDVDNDGTADFGLVNSFTYAAFFNDLAGGRVVGATTVSNDRFKKLNSGFVVSSGMTGYGFLTSAQQGPTVTYGTGFIGIDAGNQGWSVGDTGFIGFKFTANSGADTHYGWAEITIDGTGSGGSGYIINEAWYNSTPGGAIAVGAIPEPTTAAAGLGALALGAAGLRRWRKQKQAAA
jgi:hypothetical protein